MKLGIARWWCFRRTALSLFLLLSGAHAGVGLSAQVASEPGASTEGAGSAVAGQSAEPVVLSMREAVETALSQSRDLIDARLLLEEANERVSEAWGSVFPRVDFAAS